MMKRHFLNITKEDRKDNIWKQNLRKSMGLVGIYIELTIYIQIVFIKLFQIMRRKEKKGKH